MRHYGCNRTEKRIGSLMAEVLVTITVSSVIMGLAILAIHHLLKAQETHRHAVRHGLTEQRLITLFRNDCRQSAQVKAIDGGIALTSSDDRKVEYTVEENAIIRSWTGPANTGSDRFASTRDCSVKLEPLNDRRVRLVLERSAGGSKRTIPGKKNTIVVEATVGRLTRPGSPATESDEEARQ